MLTYQIYYEGKVQGVGFRATVLQLARGFDVSGEVKNLPDGRVELIVHGETQEVEDFLNALRESSLSGHICSEQKEEHKTASRFRGFKIVK